MLNMQNNYSGFQKKSTSDVVNKSIMYTQTV